MVPKSIQNKSVNQDIVATILFGVLSATLGLIQLNTPGFEGSYSDLREIGLLLCLFHLRNRLFIIPLCILTLLGLQFETRLIAVFLTHALPLFATWHIYKWIKKKQLSTIKLGLIWIFVALIYYIFLLYPVLIISYNWVGINTNVKFTDSYSLLFVSGTFEMVTTALISALYLVQLNIRRSLELTNKNLEKIVEQRTEELTKTNLELHSLNENLEQLVQERTDKIKTQLNQILKYAHMNSHEVRAPLARLLGLIDLLKKEKDDAQREGLLARINTSSIELDEIVKKMNRLLEEEVPTINGT